jgi:hypothetical protein
MPLPITFGALMAQLQGNGLGYDPDKTPAEPDSRLPLLDAMRAFLISDNWAYADTLSGTALRFTFSGDSAMWTLFVAAVREGTALVAYSDCGQLIPATGESLAVEYITRTNEGLFHGAFEYCYETRHVRYRTSLEAVDGLATQKDVRRLILRSAFTADHYHPGLMKVVYGTSTPAEALANLNENP